MSVPVAGEDAVVAFTKQMNNAGYISSNEHLMTVLYDVYTQAGRHGGAIEAVALQGPPGTGKSFAARVFARVVAAEFMTLQLTSGVGREALLETVNISNFVNALHGNYTGVMSPRDTMRPGILVAAAEASQKGRVVLLLDEMDKAKHPVDAMLLELLNEGEINSPDLGCVKADAKNLYVFLAMNDERQLSEPLMRRVRSVVLGWPDKELEWRLIRRETRRWAKNNKDFLGGKYADGVAEGLAKSLVTLANRIREAEGTCSLKKVPSTPELVRAAVDMMVTPDKRRRGRIAADWLFKYEDDRAALIEAKKFTENNEALAAVFAQFE